MALTIVGTDSYAFGSSAASTAAGPGSSGGGILTAKTDAKATTKPSTTKPTTANGKTTTKPTTKAKPKLPKLRKPKKLRSYSGYKSIKLKWSAVKGADSYIILRTVAGKKKFKQIANVKTTEYVDKVSDKIYTLYAYRVIATKKYGKYVVKSKPAKVRGQSVSRYRVYITFKKDKAFEGGTIHKGSTVRADGYLAGRYRFTYKGKRQSVARILVRVTGSKFEEKDDYSDNEASNFINDYVHRKNITTEKKYLIWVSTYTQHLYVFKMKKGRWVVAKDWEISTGRSVSPTPTGLKRIYKKVPARHGIQFWSCFSSWNSLHGIYGNMAASIGRPASHGCVRNNNGNAAWLFVKCGKGTKVLIY